MWWNGLTRRDRALIVAVVTVHLLFVVAPMDVLWPVNAGHLGRLLWHGHIPYRDFTFEYPPLAPLAFLLPGLVPAFLAKSVLALEALAAEAFVGWMVLRHHRGSLRRYGVLSLFVFPFLAGGFDAIPMAAIAVSTALLVEGRAAGWWVAGAGVLVKVSPAAIWVWGRSHGRAAVIALAATVMLALSPLLLAGSPDQTYLGWSLHRGVEVESIGASVSWIGDVVAHHSPDVVNRFRSNELRGANAEAAAVAAVALVGLALVAVATRRHGSAVDPWMAALATLLVFLCGFKVLSPQYIAWAAPLAAVIGGRWFKWYAGVAAMTFGTYLLGGQTALLTATALRNGVLVGVTIAAVRTVVRASRTAVVDGEHSSAELNRKRGRAGQELHPAVTGGPS